MNRIIISQNSLVLLCGPAGCGKSTFAAKHFLPTQVVSSDDCRALVSDDAANQKVSGHAFDLMHFIIEKRLLLLRLTVADATHLRREDRKSMLKIARWYRYEAAVIAFNTSIETCLARNRARERVVPEDALLTQYDMFQKTLGTIRDERFDRIYVIDEIEQDSAAVEIIAPAQRPRPGS